MIDALFIQSNQYVIVIWVYAFDFTLFARTILTPNFIFSSHFSDEYLFGKILVLFMVSNQEWFVISWRL